ncbi:hypothetical protein E5720_18895 [Rhodococcus sp. PAMC28707]|uniref:hypothetical protein n=1 Tax=unclassified Rhodococcus (in: high G+C Gram-positive bacteria) TaxID=192944 RepID=UPI00109DFB6C|nr:MULTISPECIES: hypothetical protein [unclassified Rhodococcus (in: high G+C Gram-positive bacteria)]QCB51599.1 hypothetical protein E5769_16630 [Rhodococcus sp. PAMC28705]QCB60233.1 hypothetical protein E5720_18895 [Rhodococcus sp. PAMC28707]
MRLKEWSTFPKVRRGCTVRQASWPYPPKFLEYDGYLGSCRHCDEPIGWREWLAARDDARAWVHRLIVRTRSSVGERESCCGGDRVPTLQHRRIRTIVEARMTAIENAFATAVERLLVAAGKGPSSTRDTARAMLTFCQVYVVRAAVLGRQDLTSSLAAVELLTPSYDWVMTFTRTVKTAIQPVPTGD